MPTGKLTPFAMSRYVRGLPKMPPDAPAWARGWTAHNGGEWICAHNVGHPDGHGGDSVHGCDGCCTRLTRTTVITGSDG